MYNLHKNNNRCIIEILKKSELNSIVHFSLSGHRWEYTGMTEHVVVIDINTYSKTQREKFWMQRLPHGLISDFQVALSSCNYRVSFACKDNQLFFLFNVPIDINDNYLDFLITHYG